MRQTGYMKTLTPGHLYELANYENPTSPGQKLQFIQKVQSPGGLGGQLDTVADGTTNEEVIKVLIDRLTHLHAKFPSDENAAAVDHLKDTLYALQSRTYERMQRGVEGKALA